MEGFTNLSRKHLFLLTITACLAIVLGVSACSRSEKAASDPVLSGQKFSQAPQGKVNSAGKATGLFSTMRQVVVTNRDLITTGPGALLLKKRNTNVQNTIEDTTSPSAYSVNSRPSADPPPTVFNSNTDVTAPSPFSNDPGTGGTKALSFTTQTIIAQNAPAANFANAPAPTEAIQSPSNVGTNLSPTIVPSAPVVSRSATNVGPNPVAVNSISNPVSVNSIPTLSSPVAVNPPTLSTVNSGTETSFRTTSPVSPTNLAPVTVNNLQPVAPTTFAKIQPPTPIVPSPIVAAPQVSNPTITTSLPVVLPSPTTTTSTGTSTATSTSTNTTTTTAAFTSTAITSGEGTTASPPLITTRTVNTTNIVPISSGGTSGTNPDGTAIQPTSTEPLKIAALVPVQTTGVSAPSTYIHGGENYGFAPAPSQPTGVVAPDTNIEFSAITGGLTTPVKIAAAPTQATGFMAPMPLLTAVTPYLVAKVTALENTEDPLVNVEISGRLTDCEGNTMSHDYKGNILRLSEPIRRSYFDVEIAEGNVVTLQAEIPSNAWDPASASLVGWTFDVLSKNEFAVRPGEFQTAYACPEAEGNCFSDTESAPWSGVAYLKSPEEYCKRDLEIQTLETYAPTDRLISPKTEITDVLTVNKTFVTDTLSTTTAVTLSPYQTLTDSVLKFNSPTIYLNNP